MTPLIRAALIAAAAGLLACRECKEHQPTARVCLPDLAAAQTPITLQAADPCTSCDFDGLSCTATIDGESGNVRLTVLTTACQRSGLCAAVCVRRDTSCVLPPLAPGERAVVVNGVLAGTLRVAEGGAGSCSLPAGPLPP
ncbi:MAG: hypothetical protein ACJ79H_12760 [Myxococcales bacterium]